MSHSEQEVTLPDSRSESRQQPKPIDEPLRLVHHHPGYLRIRAGAFVEPEDNSFVVTAAQSAAEVLRKCAAGATGLEQLPDPCGNTPAEGTGLKQRRPVAPIVILGPAEAPLSKLEGYYRQHILLKAADSERIAEFLAGPAGEALAKLRKVQTVVDVDALAML